MVESARIELASAACKAAVLPLNDDPLRRLSVRHLEPPERPVLLAEEQDEHVVDEAHAAPASPADLAVISHGAGDGLRTHIASIKSRVFCQLNYASLEGLAFARCCVDGACYVAHRQHTSRARDEVREPVDRVQRLLRLRLRSHRLPDSGALCELRLLLSSQRWFRGRRGGLWLSGWSGGSTGLRGWSGRTSHWNWLRWCLRHDGVSLKFVEAPTGIEPATVALQERCSSRLSYGANLVVVSSPSIMRSSIHRTRLSVRKKTRLTAFPGSSRVPP